MEQNKLDEIRSRAEAAQTDAYHRKPFGLTWDTSYWTKWATIATAFKTIGIPVGAEILDVGVGSGWTTVFLAEQGYLPTGVDIGPASAEVGNARAARYGVEANFVTADMDDMDLGRTYDACLVFDALHHSTRQSVVIERISRHLRPGGWVLFGEPSWLHGISPNAIRKSRAEGWVERGVRVRQVKRDCREAGLGGFRRFYEGSGPTVDVRRLPWEMARLALAPFSSSPHTSIWLAARK